MNHSAISPFWRGHLFLFDKPKATDYTSQQGSRLLLIFFFLEGVTRPLLLVGFRRLNLLDGYWWLMPILLIFLAYLLMRTFARIKPSQLALSAWKCWSKTEKVYFWQIIPITIAIFSFFNFDSLSILFHRSHLAEIFLFNLIPQLIWGFYQEFLYRGMLQTELVRRWGTRNGILTSNLLFTFGPLHAYHFLNASKNPSHLWIFAAIFCIGLFFAILFKRSGNLWIVGFLHGLGDLFIEGLAKI